MTEFVLKSETERRLYIEALLHCLDRHALTTGEILRDLQEIYAQGSQVGDPQNKDIFPRAEAILMAYQRGSRGQEEATDALLSLIVSKANSIDEIAY